jgi:chromate transporter
VRDIFRVFLSFLKVGTFVFGGGYAMIPAIRREASVTNDWMSEEELSDCIAISQSLPGAFAVNASIYIGRRVKGTPGSIAGLLGITLPAFLSILIILMFLGQIQDSPYVLGALEGIKAASVALILVTIFQMSPTMMKNKSSYIIAGLAFVMVFLLGISAMWAILMGCGTGWVSHMRIRASKKRGVIEEESL